MGRCDVSILDVLCVQRFELPVVLLLLFGVLEVGDLSEYRDLLDELLERSCMDRETVVAVCLLNARLLAFLKLLCPVDDDLFKLGTSQVAERRIFSV